MPKQKLICLFKKSPNIKIPTSKCITNIFSYRHKLLNSHSTILSLQIFRDIASYKGLSWNMFDCPCPKIKFNCSSLKRYRLFNTSSYLVSFISALNNIMHQHFYWTHHLFWKMMSRLVHFSLDKILAFVLSKDLELN